MLLRIDDREARQWQLRAPGAPASWQALEPAQVRARAGRRALHVLVPGADVLLSSVHLAPMASRRLRQAIPFALEEELAADVERLHFTPGARGADPLPVAVLASERLARWQSALASSGARVAAITPDTLAVPWAEGTWSVLLAADQAWVRQGSQSGFACERAMAVTLLDAALRGVSGAPPARAAIYTAPGDEVGRELAACLQAHGVAVTRNEEREQPLDWLGSGLDARTAINLLDGAHGAAASAAPTRHRWSRSAALLTALSVAYCALVALDHHRARTQLGELEAHVAALYQQVYPGQSVPDRPYARMVRDLAQLSGAADAQQQRLLALLASAARRLGDAPGWELQRLDFRDGRLDLELRMADAAGLDRVQRALTSDTAIAVERLSASATQGAAEARLRLRLADGVAR